jgi:hypothetical protein
LDLGDAELVVAQLQLIAAEDSVRQDRRSALVAALIGAALASAKVDYALERPVP